MDLAQLHWLSLGVGAAAGGAASLLFRSLTGTRPKEQERRPQSLDVELSRAQAELRALQGRHQQQLEFFINFPEIVKSLTAAMSIGQVTATCSRGLSALLQTQKVAIFLAETTTDLRLVDGAGFPSQARNQASYSLGCSECRQILKQRGVTSCDAKTRTVLSSQGVTGDLAASIWHGELLFGMIVVAEAQGDPLYVQRVLAMVADLTGVGLAAASRISQIRHEAENDALTGLANKRTLIRRVAAELERSLAYGTSLSLAMVDVDHFKNYNDKNGHQAGDGVLKQVAEVVKGATRRTDLVARYGGEEFTVLLIGADRAQAFRHADRIRQAIADTRFLHGEKQPLGLLSISMGVATVPQDAKRPETLFEAADRALYRAKEAGRNRVVAYTGPKLTAAQKRLGPEPSPAQTEANLRRAIALGTSQDPLEVDPAEPAA